MADPLKVVLEILSKSSGTGVSQTIAGLDALRTGVVLTTAKLEALQTGIAQAIAELEVLKQKADAFQNSGGLFGSQADVDAYKARLVAISEAAKQVQQQQDQLAANAATAAEKVQAQMDLDAANADAARDRGIRKRADERRFARAQMLAESAATIKQAERDLAAFRADQARKDAEDTKAATAARLSKILGVAGAFSVGFKSGLKIAEKAGVDTTLMFEGFDSILTKVSKGINAFVRELVDWDDAVSQLDAKFAKHTGHQVSMLEAAQALGVAIKGNEELVRRQQERMQRGIDLRQEEIAALGGEKAALHEAVLAAENEIEAKGETIGRIRALTAARVAEAKQAKATKQEILKIELEGNKRIRELQEKEQKETKEQLETRQKDELALRVAIEEMEGEKAKRVLETLKAEWAKETELRKSHQEKQAAILNSTTGKMLKSLSALYAKDFKQREKQIREEAAEWFDLWKGNAEMRLKIEEWLQGQLDTLRAEEKQSIRDQSGAIIAWDKANATQRGEIAWIATGQVIGAAQAAWSNSKELAIAGAVVNAAQGITAIWAEWASYPIIAAVLTAIEVAATGAQIKKIQDQEAETRGIEKPAPSFDDPANDAAARFAATQSARDLVNQYNGAFVGTLRSGGAHRAAGNTAPASAPMMGGGGGATINVYASPLTSPMDTARAVSRTLRQYDQRAERQIRGSRSRRVS